jgi:hypothetical protein
MLQLKSILPWGVATLACVGSVALSVSLLKSERSADQKSAQAHAKPTKSNVAAHKGNGGTKAQASISQANHPSLLSKQEETLAFLHDTSVTYDPAELPKIHPYLLSSDKEVQMAAINAMVVLGDAGASPMLREASRQVMDTDVVMEMLKAADYLELPPMDIKKMAALFKKNASSQKKDTDNKKASGRAGAISKERQKRMETRFEGEAQAPENSH